MINLTNGENVAEIEMFLFDGLDNSDDMAEEFFLSGEHLEYDADADAYYVDDLEYCIGQARDWANIQPQLRECPANTGYPPAY